jgi:ribosomal protein S27E
MSNNSFPQNRQGLFQGKKIRIFCCDCQENEAIYRDSSNRPYCIACYRGEVK